MKRNFDREKIELEADAFSRIKRLFIYIHTSCECVKVTASNSCIRQLFLTVFAGPFVLLHRKESVTYLGLMCFPGTSMFVCRGTTSKVRRQPKLSKQLLVNYLIRNDCRGVLLAAQITLHVKWQEMPAQENTRLQAGNKQVTSCVQ